MPLFVGCFCQLPAETCPGALGHHTQWHVGGAATIQKTHWLWVGSVIHKTPTSSKDMFKSTGNMVHLKKTRLTNEVTQLLFLWFFPSIRSVFVAGTFPRLWLCLSHDTRREVGQVNASWKSRRVHPVPVLYKSSFQLKCYKKQYI